MCYLLEKNTAASFFLSRRSLYANFKKWKDKNIICECELYLVLHIFKHTHHEHTEILKNDYLLQT